MSKNPKTTVDERWASKFSDVSQVIDALDNTRKENWAKYGTEILEAFDDYGVKDHHQVAFILAIINYESLFAPIREGYYLPGDYVSDELWRKNNLPYYPYYGRGFVQLTHEFNYEWAQKVVNIQYATNEDFISNPDRVMEPKYSAFIIVKGIMEGHFNSKGVGLPGYIDDTRQDYFEALRSFLGGVDRSARIVRYAQAFEKCLS